MNVVTLVISEWWLIEQVYSRQWDSSDEIGQVSSMGGKMSCWEKQLRLTLPQCSVVALPTSNQGFPLPLQHCLMACDPPTPPSAREVADCKEKTPNLPIILRVQDNPNSYLSALDTEWILILLLFVKGVLQITVQKILKTHPGQTLLT